MTNSFQGEHAPITVPAERLRKKNVKKVNHSQRIPYASKEMQENSEVVEYLRTALDQTLEPILLEVCI